MRRVDVPYQAIIASYVGIVVGNDVTRFIARRIGHGVAGCRYLERDSRIRMTCMTSV